MLLIYLDYNSFIEGTEPFLEVEGTESELLAYLIEKMNAGLLSERWFYKIV